MHDDNPKTRFDNPTTQFFVENSANALNEEQGQELYSYASRVLDRIERQGLGGRSRPKLEEMHTTIYAGVKAGQYFDGRLPVLLKKLNMDQLSALMSLFSNWYGYLTSQLNLIAAERSEAKRQKEMLWSMIRMEYFKRAKKLGLSFTDQKLSDMARFDRRYVECDAKFEEVNILYGMLQALLDVASNDMKVVSREVTIREVLIESEARGRGFGAPSRFAVEAPAFKKVTPIADEEPENDQPEGEEAEAPAKPRRKVVIPANQIERRGVVVKRT